MRTVIKRGHADWDDLIGKEISFDWQDGYDDIPYWFEGVFEGIQNYPEEYGYYILLDDGGVRLSETETVKVTVHD